MRHRMWLAVPVLLASGAATAAPFRIGQKVEAWNIAWYPGTIAEIGSGSYAGYYRVHWDSGTSQWVKASNIRAADGSSGNAATAAGAGAATAQAPRPGRYVCMGYNGGVGMFRWYLSLSGGTYRQAKPDLPAGAFQYSPASRTLTFLSGPYSRNNWIGLFSVEREGKTHKIVLRDRAKQAQGPRVGEYSNIYCTNSTDS